MKSVFRGLVPSRVRTLRQRACRQERWHAESCFRWQPGTDEIPVPCIAPDAIARIAQRFAFEPFGIEAYGSAVGDQEFTIARDEVRHRPSHPDMAVQPESAGHRMCHPFAAVFELTPTGR